MDKPAGHPMFAIELINLKLDLCDTGCYHNQHWRWTHVLLRRQAKIQFPPHQSTKSWRVSGAQEHSGVFHQPESQCCVSGEIYMKPTGTVFINAYCVVLAKLADQPANKTSIHQLDTSSVVITTGCWTGTSQKVSSHHRSADGARDGACSPRGHRTRSTTAAQQRQYRICSLMPAWLNSDIFMFLSVTIYCISITAILFHDLKLLN